MNIEFLIIVSLLCVMCFLFFVLVWREKLKLKDDYRIGKRHQRQWREEEEENHERVLRTEMKLQAGESESRRSIQQVPEGSRLDSFRPRGQIWCVEDTIDSSRQFFQFKQLRGCFSFLLLFLYFPSSTGGTRYFLSSSKNLEKINQQFFPQKKKRKKRRKPGHKLESNFQITT